MHPDWTEINYDMVDVTTIGDQYAQYVPAYKEYATSPRHIVVADETLERLGRSTLKAIEDLVGLNDNLYVDQNASMRQTMITDSSGTDPDFDFITQLLEQERIGRRITTEQAYKFGEDPQRDDDKKLDDQASPEPITLDLTKRRRR